LSVGKVGIANPDDKARIRAVVNELYEHIAKDED
jgi:hypothetical protein